MGKVTKKTRTKKITDLRKLFLHIRPLKFIGICAGALIVIIAVVFSMHVLSATSPLISDGINPAITPTSLPNITPRLYVSDAFSVQPGWVAPQDQSWTVGYSYQIPSDWGLPGAEGCGPTYTPGNKDSNLVWISLCGPDINGYKEAAYWNTRMQQGRVIEKKKVTIKGNPALYSIVQESGGAWSAEYFLYINTITKFAGFTSKLNTGAIEIGLTAHSQEKLNEYLPVFDQFINKLYFADKDKLNQLSRTSCEIGKPIMENKIAQFEHAQYAHDIKGIFTILNDRVPETTEEIEAQTSMTGRLFKENDLSYSVISYAFNGGDVYLPGMCIVHVQEERKAHINNQLQNIVYPRNFIFSDFNQKWKIEGYYGSDVEFTDRNSGFYNIGFSDNRNLFRKLPYAF